LESPQQILNIAGLKWLRKDYIVETEICIGSGCFTGSSMRRTFIFAALLDVQNNEVPLNRKAFSKALQSSLKDAATLKHKKSPELIGLFYLVNKLFFLVVILVALDPLLISRFS
jgi:hypothetical protein